MINSNWVIENTSKEIRNKAQAVLDSVKDNRKGRKTKLIKVDAKTYKEVLV